MLVIVSASARGVGHGNWCFGRHGCEANVQAAQVCEPLAVCSAKAED